MRTDRGFDMNSFVLEALAASRFEGIILDGLDCQSHRRLGTTTPQKGTRQLSQKPFHSVLYDT